MLYTNIQTYIQSLDTKSIGMNRREELDHLIYYIQSKTDLQKTIRLNFICTHNSRRSHLAQIWAQTLAYYTQTSNIQSYSGGTEITHINQTIITTLQNTGFKIDKLAENNNSIYSLKYASNEPSIILFSKLWNSIYNPSTNFAAILTCIQAEKECPLIPTADTRLFIPYNDPKGYDNTTKEQAKYNECSKQIATEMLYVFLQLKTEKYKNPHKNNA